MTKHDQSRRDALIKTLSKAKEQAETAKLYLVANDRAQEDIAAAHDALDHIEIALERLGAVATT